MFSKSQSIFTLFFSSFLFLSSSTINAFNISQILGNYPSFAVFNNLLTQTQLANAINSRKTITVLVVDNGAIMQMAGQSMDTIKKILSLHVILDYYDVEKLQQLHDKVAMLTTLFQSSGEAIGQQGFLIITHTSDGGFAFGSAVTGSNANAIVVKSVDAQPYDISVLQVSNVVMPLGIGGGSNSSIAVPPSPSSAPGNSPGSDKNTIVLPPPSHAPSPSNVKPPIAGGAPATTSPVNSPANSPAKPPIGAPGSSPDHSPANSPAKPPTPTPTPTPTGSPANSPGRSPAATPPIGGSPAATPTSPPTGRSPSSSPSKSPASTPTAGMAPSTSPGKSPAATPVKPPTAGGSPAKSPAATPAKPPAAALTPTSSEAPAPSNTAHPSNATSGGAATPSAATAPIDGGASAAGPAADAPAGEKSSGVRQKFGIKQALVMLVSFTWSLLLSMS